MASAGEENTDQAPIVSETTRYLGKMLNHSAEACLIAEINFREAKQQRH